MRLILSSLAFLALFGLVALPAVAAENISKPAGLTKGTKSYQSRTISSGEASQGMDVSGIEPAAGDDISTPSQPDQSGSDLSSGKKTQSLEQKMHLPRKN